MPKANILDITERLENTASTVYSGAYAVMTEARKTILGLRAMRKRNTQFAVSSAKAELAELLEKMKRTEGTVHSGAAAVLAAARQELVDQYTALVPAESEAQIALD